ncbi:MAG: alanine racemase [Mogibacterium sp.]|nr:alanine racemase [Mogibacterium sp.]
MDRYPALTIDHDKLRSNMKTVVDWCAQAGIDVAGVIKVSCGLATTALDYEAAGAKWIASSRIEHLRRAKEIGVKLPMLMIRVPMISELDEIIEVCDYSLQSELKTLEAINEKAIAAGKVHNVILMADTGDLREGFIDYDEMTDVAVKVENELKGLHLAGIGTNLGCTGSVIPTGEKMELLASIAEKIEKAIGRELEIVSGGASSSLLPLFDGVMPKKINMLRIGELSYVGNMGDLKNAYDRNEVDDMYGDAVTLQAEIIECKTKPSHPIGELGVNAFGERPVYIDKGDRRRALCAIGRADFGDTGDIIPMLEGASVEAASGDHTIVDIEECKTKLDVGDIMTFKLKYSAILRLTGSENVKIREINK